MGHVRLHDLRIAYVKVGHLTCFEPEVVER